MGVAETVHMDGLDAHAGTAIPPVGGTNAVAGVLLAMTPFVKCEVLATHSDRRGRFWG